MNEQRQFNFFMPWPPVETYGWEEGVRRLGTSSPIVERYGVPGKTPKEATKLKAKWRRA